MSKSDYKYENGISYDTKCFCIHMKDTKQRQEVDFTI